MLKYKRLTMYYSYIYVHILIYYSEEYIIQESISTLIWHRILQYHLQRWYIENVTITLLSLYIKVYIPYKVRYFIK